MMYVIAGSALFKITLQVFMKLKICPLLDNMNMLTGLHCKYGLCGRNMENYQKFLAFLSIYIVA